MRNIIVTYDIDDAKYTFEQFVAFLSENRNVKQWLVPYLGAVFVKSDSELLDLRNSFEKFTSGCSFVLAEVDPLKMAGSLPIGMWDWINRGVLPDELVDAIAKRRNEFQAQESSRLLEAKGS